MKVSVVIPAYNEEHYIGRTLEALLLQDYRDVEIIVVNNASTDRTEEIAKRTGVHVVYEAKKGLLHARERGRVEATGDIIVNLDADCIPSKDWISKGVSFIKDKKVVAVTGPYDYYDASAIVRFFTSVVQATIYSGVNYVGSYIGRGVILTGGNSFLRAEALNEVGGYNTGIQFYGEDTDTANRIVKHGKVLYIPSLKLKSSARRFKQIGFFKTTFKYMINFASVNLLGKPFHKVDDIIKK